MSHESRNLPSPEERMHQALQDIAFNAQEPLVPLVHQARRIARRRRYRNFGVTGAAVAAAVLPIQMGLNFLAQSRDHASDITPAVSVGPIVDRRCQKPFPAPSKAEPRLAQDAVLTDVLKCTYEVRTVDGRQWTVAQENHSRGSLLPFAEALKRPDYKLPPGDKGGCNAVYVSHTNIWVRTSDGEWLQPHWPTARCGTSVSPSTMPEFVKTAEQPTVPVPAIPAVKR